ncbi:MAG: CRISPR-associated endoribonuclease Cas2 3 [Verrucomicrobia subdivision 3 bacterium]|nr:CRISPR-associated endoribonuclease Cas2 3 [Limisphaerales bacterium]MCS1416474.1 CRISPR-associated endoribonuclease Cas2 3 [Limisphaerales bacterium]
MPHPDTGSSIPLGTWWEEAFPKTGYKKSPPGQKQMLILIAYDVTKPRRLARVARVCEDYGFRVQYSVFECHLKDDQFQEFWGRLLDEIDEAEDRLVAYKLDAKNARQTLTAGAMVCSEKVVCYLV